jgi:hypothetical protein
MLKKGKQSVSSGEKMSKHAADDVGGKRLLPL